MNYAIRIRGHLDSSWQDRFDGLCIEQQETGTTLLSGALPDQAALHGVLLQIIRLGLTLLSLETSEAPHGSEVISDRSEKKLYSTSPQSNCGKVSNPSEYEEVFMSQLEKNGTQEPARSTDAINKQSKRWTDEERAAMKERAKELKAEERANRNRAEGESDVLAKIAEMAEPDRTMARRVHEIIKASAPVLMPKTWYGMPAYARDGKIVCFFQCAQKFNTRYATLGFNDAANLDEGAMWPTSFALKELTAAEEARISALVKKAVS